VGDKGFDEHAGNVGSRQPQLDADSLQGFFMLRLHTRGHCFFFSHAGIEAHCGASFKEFNAGGVF
jgi:hypothetical protein